MNEDKELTQLQEDVLSLIKKGYENKVNIRYIAKLCGISYRQVIYIIADLRQFYPICSTTLDGGGVWIADCNKDIVDFVKQIQKLRDTHQQTINYMEGHIR